MATPSSSRRPSERENASAVAVCILLAAALAWMLHAQARMSPAVSIAFHSAGSDGAAAPLRAQAPDLVFPLPAALQPMSAAEAFSPATLSDKIDGKAEVYLTAGFVGLRCQRLALAGAPGMWLELYVFDMGKPANAFSVFSSQKRSDVTDLHIGDYAYRAGNEVVLVHGPFYVELIATDETPAAVAAATELATDYVAATAVTAHADVSLDEARFPRDGLVAGSVKLLSADVFGFDGLKDVFIAHYSDGPDELTLFFSRRATADEAAKAAAALHGFFVKDCGGREAAHPQSPVGAAVIDGGGSFDGIFTSGPFLAGVHQAPSRDSAERWMKRLGQSLSAKR